MNQIKKIILPIYLWGHKKWIRLCWSIFTKCKINKKKILFSNFSGGPYCGSPSFIANEMIKQGLDYKLLWMVDGNKWELPEKVLPVQANTTAFVYHMATAGTWVDNTRKLYYYVKRPEQYYLYTSHGRVGFKKMESQSEDTLSKEYISYAKKDSKNVDSFLASCQRDVDRIKEVFWYDGEILAKGFPAHDIYFENREVYRKKVLDFFGLSHDTKIYMYAPTFRDSRKTDMYHLDYEKVKNALEERFGGCFVALASRHPNLSAAQYPIAYSETIKDATLYENIQELMVACDVMISDYSNCIIDFSYTKRPGFLYAEDYPEFKATRGCNFDLEDTPYPLAESNQELIDNILNFDEEKFAVECEAYHQSFGPFDDGHASEAAVEAIKERISKA